MRKRLAARAKSLKVPQSVQTNYVWAGLKYATGFSIRMVRLVVPLNQLHDHEDKEVYEL